MKLTEAKSVVENLSDRFIVSWEVSPDHKRPWYSECGEGFGYEWKWTYTLKSDVGVHYQGTDLEEMVSTAKYVVTHPTPRFNC
tara:strand:- start:357 stop:605 length:249 start_codon:yes stop_codon:yes gene_type:complete